MKYLIRNSVMAVALAGLVSVGAVAQTGSDKGADQRSSRDSSKEASRLSAADHNFVKKAAAGGMAEVELGRLATEKASSDDVKKFGQRMVDDHSKANDQLKQLASQKGVSLPSELEAKDKALKDRLSKLTGAEFDRAYMKNMVRDHTKDVAEFRKESKSAKDDDLKNFASQTLPTLEDHLKQAKSIEPKENKQAMSEKPSPEKSTQQ